MRNYVQKLILLIVLTGFFSVQAGAYEDFFAAVRADRVQTVRQLLARGFDPNTPDPELRTGLLIAANEPSPKVAELLVSMLGIDLNRTNKAGENALMLAALRGQEALAVKMTLLGAAVNKEGWTPLHYAATGGHLRLVAFLLGAGADANAESPNGTTPLMMGAMYGNSNVVKLLLESGAEAYPRNDQGLSALDFAQKAGREDSARLIQQVLDR